MGTGTAFLFALKNMELQFQLMVTFFTEIKEIAYDVHDKLLFTFVKGSLDTACIFLSQKKHINVHARIDL